eukprot:TRINITY_DN36953_c0_g1_i2.p1 TRINITY_DN36953_c0_g1~~TRINITY_DN36953_c0_g1_i2.p1  ORF type:complete len:307 (-),score=34.92 TRINITY_DN36953_c0_g1_i2:1461-2282(-)
MAGETFELVESSLSSVEKLKQSFAPVSQVPALCQVLISAGTPLTDSETLSDLCTDDALDVAMYVDLEPLMPSLKSKGFRDKTKRMEALRVLGEFPAPASPPVIDAIALLLKDTHYEVQDAAVKLICEITEKGNQQVLEHAVSLLMVHRPNGRYVSRRMISAVALPDDERVVAALLNFFSRRWPPKSAAPSKWEIESLMELFVEKVSRGNSVAIEGLICLLDNPTVRWPATKALMVLAATDTRVAAALRTQGIRRVFERIIDTPSCPKNSMCPN